MTSDPTSANIANQQPPTPADDSIWLAMGLRRSNKVVLVVDLVESVRLMEDNEALAVKRWRAFLLRVTGEVLPNAQGRLVKSLGDGLMLEFEHPRQAASAAKAMHEIAATISHGCPPEQTFALRVGAHSAEVYADDIDIYGAGVNLAARLASLAGPGETVVSSTVRDELTDGLDADVEDLGECFLKHVALPVHAWRIDLVGHKSNAVPSSVDLNSLLPVIAVAPFAHFGGGEVSAATGDLVAEGVIAALCASSGFRVISRHSSAALRASPGHSLVRSADAALGIDFLLKGACHTNAGNVTIDYLLLNVKSSEVLSTGRVVESVASLLNGNGHAAHEMACVALNAVGENQVRQALLSVANTLPDYTLLLAGTRLVHSTDLASFVQARELLSALADRQPRIAAPRVWLAKWHALASTKGCAGDPSQARRAAFGALDQIQPGGAQEAFALAVRGFVYLHLEGDYSSALDCMEDALLVDANESLAWLFRSVVLTLRGEHAQAIESYERAHSFSPIDPMRYLYTTIGASVYLGAGQHERAIEIGKTSWRLNRNHAHTARILAMAHAEIDDLPLAKKYLDSARRLQPDLSLKSFMSRSAKDNPVRERYARALKRAGLT